jgi:predicted DsbA family dithiol-disulfide isomerase
VKIDLVGDIVCPWCYIGTERLVNVIAGDASVQVTHRPFLLDPGTPEAGVSLPEMLRKKYGAEPAAMFARPEAAARESGIPLDFAKVPKSYPTTKAHTLVRHAPDGLAMARALYRAHFVESENIADLETLVRIGGAHGVAEDTVRRVLGDATELAETRGQADAARRGGVTGVPFFVFAGRLGVSGAQSEAVLLQALTQAQGQALGQKDL